MNAYYNGALRVLEFESFYALFNNADVLFLLKCKNALLVLAECTNACRGWKKRKEKRTSWRELVFFQSDSVAVKFRAWIFNQNGFPVKTFFFWLGPLSLHNKKQPLSLQDSHNEQI